MGALILSAYRAGAYLSRWLPLQLSYAIADVLAELHFLVRRTPRLALLKNLEVVSGDALGDKNRRRLARAIFRNFGRSLVDFLRLPSLDAEALRQQVSVEGLQTLEDALASDRGVVFLTCHIGAWELGGRYLSTLGFPLNTVALDHSTREVTEFFARHRRESGIRVLGVREGEGVFRGLLDRGECLAVLGDWDALGWGSPVTFFGRRTRLPSAYVNLAARSGVQILPGIVVRRADGGYHVRLDRAIRPLPGNAQATLERCLQVLERYISENLTQWFAFRPIWPEEARGAER